jgi:hypothetical protein
VNLPDNLNRPPSMQTTSRLSPARREPLVLDGRIVDGCVKVVGIEPRLQLGRLVAAASTALIAQLVALFVQIAGRSPAASPGGWKRA